MYNNKRKANKYENMEIYQDAHKPEERHEYNDLISYKALKDLPKHPVTLQADPYTNALPGSVPYALLNRYNRIVGGTYNGDKNLDGGNVKQYANSVTSKFLNIFDTALLKVFHNYRYLPISTDDDKRGAFMIDEMRRAIAEATSVLAATTFINQNIYNYMVCTDMPMGSAVPTFYNNAGIPVYTEIQDVIYAMGIIYQIHLQSVILAFNQFNAFRTKQGEMMRMSFNRETPTLNAYFGLMNKKAFLNLWDSLAYTVQGEYIDEDAMVQTNMLGLISSRKSESMNDSLLEIAGEFNYPDHFSMYFNTTPAAGVRTLDNATLIFDMAQMQYTNSLGDTLTFYAACHDLMGRMTVNDTLLWARTIATNGMNDTTRYNICKFDLDVITYCMTYFKTCFNDLRSVLDVMAGTGVNQWVKGVKLKVIESTDSVVNQNLIVDNIYSMVLGGCNEVSYDDRTKRWSLFTLWNQFYGIPEHDTYSGGVFLTLSTKQFRLPPDVDTDVTLGYLPIAFNVAASGEGTVCRIVNRLGLAVPISYDIIDMQDNIIYSRLIPLNSQNNYQLRVPNVVLSGDMDADAAIYTNVRQAFIYKWMLQVIGSACIPGSRITDPDADVDEFAPDYGLDNNVFAVYDLQIEDFTNEVITYARTKAMFRANSVDTSKLGFFGLKRV